MPIYVYQREDGTVFDKLQKISEDVLTVCPTTGQKVERKITAPAVHFKGTGFYQTDYKPSASPGSSSSSSKDNDSSSASGNITSDSKGSADNKVASTGGCTGSGPSGGCPSC